MSESDFIVKPKASALVGVFIVGIIFTLFAIFFVKNGHTAFLFGYLLVVLVLGLISTFVLFTKIELKENILSYSFPIPSTHWSIDVKDIKSITLKKVRYKRASDNTFVDYVMSIQTVSSGEFKIKNIKKFKSRDTYKLIEKLEKINPKVEIHKLIEL